MILLPERSLVRMVVLANTLHSLMSLEEAVKRPETVCSKKLKATVLIRGLLKLLQYGR